MRAFRVSVFASDEDAASAALWEAGTSGIEVRPAAAGRLELIAYFPDTTSVAALQALLPAAALEPAEIPDIDWVQRFREGFRPLRAGRFQILPVWDAPGGDVGRDLLIIDPGRAFGTGTHETTRLCLGALEDLAGRRPLGRTLDLGAGTGILAIAAARLGASRVVASDLDPDALESARLHSRLNRTELALVRADGARGFRPGSFDLVLANLMALLLVDRAPEIGSLLAPGAALVLSGLLLDDVSSLRSAFAHCGTPSERRDGEWAALVYEGLP